MEQQELDFLNEMTRRNRGLYPVRRRMRLLPAWFGPGLRWMAECTVLTILAHTGAIAGWIMHLGTVLLTFRFAFGVGRCLK